MKKGRSFIVLGIILIILSIVLFIDYYSMGIFRMLVLSGLPDETGLLMLAVNWLIGIILLIIGIILLVLGLVKSSKK